MFYIFVNHCEFLFHYVNEIEINIKIFLQLGQYIKITLLKP